MNRQYGLGSCTLFLLPTSPSSSLGRSGRWWMFSEKWHSAVIDFGCVSSKILWIKFKFSRVIVCVVVGYGSNEGDCEERDRFWTDMARLLNRVWIGYKLCVLKDVNGWIGDRTRASITSDFGVPGESDNGRRVVEFCAEIELCGGVTYTLYTGVCISTQGQQRVKTEWR